MTGESPTLPIETFDTLFHVGHLTGAARAPRYSLEGHCLSVSQYPEAWRQIARLGDAPCWIISRHDTPGRFVDAHDFLNDNTAVHAMMNWACDQGLAVPATLFRVVITDEMGKKSMIPVPSSRLQTG